MACIINADNGAISGSAGVKTTADSTGVLNIQTNGTTAISISASQAVSFTNTPTFTGGTANGVLYLNGSKVATSGTALVFDGTNLQVGATPGAEIRFPRFSDNAAVLSIKSNTSVNELQLLNNSGGGSNYLRLGNGYLSFGAEASEGMRLTSTGLGIGTTAPASKLDVTGGFSTSTTAFTIYNNSASSASNIARIDFRVNNTFGGNERVAAIWGMNPNAAGNNGGALVFGVSANGTATTPSEVARLDSSGNLGLGLTPSAWNAFWTNLQVRYASFGGSYALPNFAVMASNTYSDGATYNSGKYIANGNATYYQQLNGVHSWYTAASGTAGNAISFTQAMTLDASGNLGIGTTSPATRIHAERSTDGVIGTFRGPSNAQYLVGIASGVVTHDASNGSAIHTWQTNGTERARITSGGNFGIGTTAPVNKLSVIGLISDSDSNFTASAYIHASPDSGANRNIGQFSVSGASNGLQINWNHASSRMHIIINNIPTSSAGLPSGTLYSDGGTIKIA
jgi:hypothetical protein